MSEYQDYLAIKARNKLKKQIRYQKPYLYGQALDHEIDRLIGISTSDKMDWAQISAIITPPAQSNYPTPESIGEDEVVKIAQEYSIRPYILYWFYLKKIQTLKSSGREKHDYLAVLTDCAAKSIRRTLTDEEKMTAVKIYAKNLRNIELSQGQLNTMLFRGEL